MTASFYRNTILPKIRSRRILHDVSLELTYGCNLDCFYCYNDRDKTGTLLTLEHYYSLLQDLADMQVLYLMLTGGEPMLHPHFFEIGGRARELGFVTRIRTNGHSLGRQNVARIVNEVDPYKVELSLHGATAAVHDRQTRVAGSFERLTANIRLAVAAGLRVEAVCTPTAWNEHQILDMFALCDSLGVRLRYQGPVAPRDNGDREPLSIQPSGKAWELILAEQERRRPASAAASEPLTADASPEPRDSFVGTCSVGVGGVDIDPYGNVKACMHLSRNAGSVYDRSIKAIWEDAPLFREARQRAEAAALAFAREGQRPGQFGAPVYCLAVEENCNKGCESPRRENTPADLIRLHHVD